ncbi:MAG: hypothetical protein IT345_13805 [Trueperaceae bacterium]|nr:hypothetical protein [Trueperaceae bacterium]
MEQTGRFQRNQELRRDGDVVTNVGVDVVTGLPVLVYDFPGSPTLTPGQAELDGIPAVLAASAADGRGCLVVAYPNDATLVAPGESVIDDKFALRAATILRDAARRGIAHGDLGPGRFLWSGGALYLEGYGVPWRPGLPVPQKGAPVPAALTAALQADLRNAVKALAQLGERTLSAEVMAVLRAAAAGSSNTDAGGLQATLRRLAGGAVTVPSAGFADIVLPTTSGTQPARSGSPEFDALEFPSEGPPSGSPPRPETRTPPVVRSDDVLNLDFAGEDGDPDQAGDLWTAPTRTPARGTPTPRVPPDQPPARPAEEPSRPASQGGRPTPSEPDPITVLSDPGTRPAATGKPRSAEPRPRGSEGETGFVKHLPPGATYRPGTLDDAPRPAPIRVTDTFSPVIRRRSWRGPALLVLLVLLVALGTFLALRAQRASNLGQVGAGAVRHLVDVRVDPTNLPPVSLVVDASPDGSGYKPGTIIGSVPRRVAFDANGTWVVHARFQGRSSEHVTLHVPDDVVITLSFPEPTPPAP